MEDPSDSTLISFATQNGALALAERFFDLYKFTLKCGYCKSEDPGKQRFIRDSGGKSPVQAKSRRQYTCGRRNRGLTTCARLSCGPFIELVRSQLEPEEFNRVVKRVQQRFHLRGFSNWFDGVQAKEMEGGLEVPSSLRNQG